MKISAVIMIIAAISIILIPAAHGDLVSGPVTVVGPSSVR